MLLIGVALPSTELRQEAAKRKQRVTATEGVCQASVGSPYRMQGLIYHEIKITGGGFERFILSLLTWWGLWSGTCPGI